MGNFVIDERLGWGDQKYFLSEKLLNICWELSCLICIQKLYYSSDNLIFLVT